MSVGNLRVLAALLLGTAAGASPAFSQGRPWVDPPANLSSPPAPVVVPTEKPKAEEPKRSAAKPEPEVVRTEVEQPDAKPETASSKPAAKAASRTARTKVSNRPRSRARVAEGQSGTRADGLVVMQMQTLQFPDGRQVQVLTRPGAPPELPHYMRDGWR